HRAAERGVQLLLLPLPRHAIAGREHERHRLRESARRLRGPAETHPLAPPGDALLHAAGERWPGMSGEARVGAGAPRAKITAPAVVALKRKGEPITVVTAYDFPTARYADQAGVEILLVGDSVGTVMLGYESTLPVTMEDML